MPSYDELDDNFFLSLEAETDFLPVNAGLVEDAFYKQRYLVNPEGVYVRLTGARNFTGLHLKIHPAERKNALVDVLARLETNDGAFFTVLTEDRLLEASNVDIYPSVRSYAAYIICQVYHDLVTAEELPTGSKARSSVPVVFGKPSEDRNFSWTVIPRRGRKSKPSEPRSKIAEATIMEPRRVVGHLRKVPMTDAHREAIRQFEREYGLEVLRFVPEGETFVRPHFSPATTAEELQQLPRFIRYRIQQAFEEAMRNIHLKK